MVFSKKFVCATSEYTTTEKNVPAPYLRRTFTYEEKPKKATITLCALGFYRLFVNGKEITRSYLAPYIVNPDQVLPYDTYDITEHMILGENTVAFLLGNGMQNCLGGFVWYFHEATYRSAPKLAFHLSVTLSDKELTYEADENLLCMPSPMYFDDLRMGVKYDARRENSDWNLPCANLADATPAIPASTPIGEAMLVDCHPIVVTRRISPVRIWEEDGSFIYDFGENAAGVSSLCVKGTYGQHIVIDHAEMLLDGKFSQKNITFRNPASVGYPKYTQRTEYICKGSGTEEFVPSFTYYGFRYAKVSGITKEQATADLLTYLVMNTELTSRGSFECSSQTLNTLYEMTRRSTLANFYHFPTDCPQREKNGWTADAALSAEHTLLNFDAEDNYLMWLRSITRAMNHEGALPGIVPTAGWGFDWGNGPAWDSVLFYLPYYMSVLRDDLRGAKEVAASMLRYLHYLTTRMDDNGLLAIGLGDWCAPVREHKPPLIFTDSVVSYDLAKKAQYLYTRLGMAPEASYAKQFADNIYKAIRKHLLVDAKTMRFLGDTQSSQAMAIFYGLCENEEEKRSALSLLLSYIEQKDGHISCGVLGGRVIFRVLCDNGYHDLAYRMIVRKDPPAYGYMIEAGYTALAEDIAPYPTSLNHHFWGDIAAVMMEYFAGIRINPTANDAKQVLISPVFVTELSFARAKHETPYGTISVAWERTDQAIKLHYDAASTLEVRIEAPDGYTVGKLADGEYLFSQK